MSNKSDIEIDWELINWEPPEMKLGFLISYRKEGMGPNEWISEYEGFESADKALEWAYSKQGVVEAKVRDMNQSWDSLRSELPGGDKFSWQGD